MRLRYQLGIGIALVLLTTVGMWVYLCPSSFKERRDFLTLVVQVVGGSVLLFGAYSAWRQLITTERGLQVTREGQVTERFTRAVEMLGSDDPTVRIGAIHSLERIASDSETHHWPAVEVLLSFIERNAKWDYEEIPDHIEPKPSEEVQQALTAICRRSPEFERDYDRLRLRNADLRGADLSLGQLEGVRFAFVHLDKASFIGSRLKEALMDQVKMRSAFLYKADLRDTVFINVDLTDAVLQDADLSGADLSAAEGLSQDQIELVARADSATKLPPGLSLPKRFSA